MGEECCFPATSNDAATCLTSEISRNLQANHDPAAWKFVIAGEVRCLLPYLLPLPLLFRVHTTVLQIGFHAYPTGGFGPFTPAPESFAGMPLHA